ncbi:MAG: hypothetical protein O3B13_11765 [Planctomycetota bacterium]|nr:hypothetical protein [Planctomycetota bacterium]MDA1163770.1 hypothetical protein [Planctomycetota bacterium]
MEQQIVPGISLAPSGQATVDPSLADVLFELALALEEPTQLPVDVQHVVAAIILAARTGELETDASISSDDPSLVALLVGHVKTVFNVYGGKVGRDD